MISAAYPMTAEMSIIFLMDAGTGFGGSATKNASDVHALTWQMPISAFVVNSGNNKLRLIFTALKNCTVKPQTQLL